MRLDTERHDSHPIFEDGGKLHVILADGGKKAYEIDQLKSWIDRDGWHYPTDVEMAGVTSDGRWVLVTTSDADDEVREFASRLHLCQYLVGLINVQPAALQTLHQLGAICFEPELVKLMTERDDPNMTSDLKTAIAAFKGKVRAKAVGAAMAAYGAGQFVRRVFRDERRYGSASVEHLAWFTGDLPTRLYGLAGMVDVFTREQVRQMAGRNSTAGWHPSVEHLVVLSRIKNCARRRAWFGRLLAESLDVGQLVALIDADAQARADGGARR